MHEMQTIVTDVRGVSTVGLSVSLSVTRLNSASLCGGHLVQPLPNHFGLLFGLLCVVWGQLTLLHI